jgi:hypothetical protein
MLTAVQLDDELRLHARKVGDVGAEAYLPSELEVGELTTSHRPPKQPLGVGCFAAKAACLRMCLTKNARHGGSVARVDAGLHPHPASLAAASESPSTTCGRGVGELSRRRHSNAHQEGLLERRIGMYPSSGNDDYALHPVPHKGKPRRGSHGGVWNATYLWLSGAGSGRPAGSGSPGRASPGWPGSGPAPWRAWSSPTRSQRPRSATAHPTGC